MRHTARIAVFIIFEKDFDVFLMRRDNTSHKQGELGLPSGHVEEGETPEEAVIRETREETGIILLKEKVRLVHTQYNMSGSEADYMNLYFAAERWSGEPEIREVENCSESIWTRLPFIGDKSKLPDDLIS